MPGRNSGLDLLRISGRPDVSHQSQDLRIKSKRSRPEFTRRFTRRFAIRLEEGISRKMCGISGVVNCGDRETLARMTHVQAHRGPDDSGMWDRAFPDGTYVGLGSRRPPI